jgi:hypothetical protein
MASRNPQANGAEPTAPTYDIRRGARYLQDNGIDVGEMRMRTLLRENDAFVSDPNTQKVKQGDSEIEKWVISQAALDAYIAARKSGTGGRAPSGAKMYKLALTQDEVAAMRAGTATPEQLVKWGEALVSANKNKSKAAAPAAQNGTQDEGQDGECEPTLDDLIGTNV